MIARHQKSAVAHLHLGRVLQQLGSFEEAIFSFERALALSEPEGYVRLFADEGAPMIDLLRRAQARGSAPTYVALLLAACSARVAGGAQSCTQS